MLFNQLFSYICAFGIKKRKEYTWDAGIFTERQRQTQVKDDAVLN